MFERDFSAGGSRWPLVRISVGGRTQVTLLSSSLLPLCVHWIGKSVVCCRDGCALCDWLPVRGLYYAATMCDAKASLIELGALSASHLEQHCKLLHGGLRPGLVVELSRRFAKSPVHSEVVDQRAGVAEVPTLTLVERVMAIYQLPGSNPGEELERYEARLRAIVRVRSEHEARRLQKRAQPGVHNQA